MKTTIGFGSPNKADSHDAHGAPLGADEAEATRKQLGWNYGEFEAPKLWSRKRPGVWSSPGCWVVPGSDHGASKKLDELKELGAAVRPFLPGYESTPATGGLVGMAENLTLLAGKQSRRLMLLRRCRTRSMTPSAA